MKAETVERPSFELPIGRPAAIVVVSDSHGRPHANAYGQIAQEQPDLILHAGDIGPITVLDRLAAIAPTLAVRGNVDGRDPRTPDVLVADLNQARQRKLRILMTHIGVYGAALRSDARRLVRDAQADVFICGHSHVPLIAQEGRLLLFNPGSFGPRRFRLPITFGAFELAERVQRLRHIDCESGADWSPPR